MKSGAGGEVRFAGFIHGFSVACAIASLVLLPCPPARAACNPETCDAVFACGFRECVGATCETFPDDAGTLCRSAAGVCDLAESCNGTSTACPTNKKNSAASLCREAAGPCDVAEHCDGVSDACPADTGSDPFISEIIFLAGTHHAGGVVLGHDVAIDVIGSNLCTARIQMPDLSERSLEPEGDGGRPSSRLSLVESYASPEARASDFPDGSYPIEINGFAMGVLDFESGAPDGRVDILDPVDGASVGAAPTFSFLNQCTNCLLMRVAIFDDPHRFLVEALLPPFDISIPTQRDVGELFGAAALPAGHYEIHAEALDGLFEARSFPPSVPSFDYLSGTTLRDEVGFTVPEPASPSASFAVVAAIAGLGRLRAARQRGRA